MQSGGGAHGARWPNGCPARNVAKYANRDGDEEADFLSALEAASGKPMRRITATTVAWRLKAIADAPVDVAGEVLVLRYNPDHQGGLFTVKNAA